MRARRRVFADIAPLRASADFRRLYVGQLVSFLGSQLAVVAVPYQVFRLTGSSFQVGLVSLAQLGPLLIGTLVGGDVADRMDRRRLILAMQIAHGQRRASRWR
jgi:ENTS family enterobactin (siderophore) exporter